MMLVSGLLFLLYVFPSHPKTGIGWVLFFLLALPLIIVGEKLGELILNRKFLNQWPSLCRILYGVIVLSVICAIIVGVLYLLKPVLDKW